MTSNEFRKMALALPEAVEKSHMGHPDFRVGGKIFATLGVPDLASGIVKLTPDEQEVFVQIEPEGFQSVKGGWGRQGATNVRLRSAKKSTVREALSRCLASSSSEKPGARLEKLMSLSQASPRRRSIQPADLI